ncbi:MAG TPA: hypothetical protein VNV88_04380 [Candidatus Solibacter sp.]|jgi:hypothetical protein|nr:hypothetical protein [Candidatus Solibacter sp.]
MNIENEKRIMFEIYREAAGSGCYRVVYFTELGEHERETEIGKALRGDHVFDGFILSRERWQAKQAVERILDRLNSGAAADPGNIEHELKPFMVL